MTLATAGVVVLFLALFIVRFFVLPGIDDD
jgi:hypothetical protein